MLTVRHSFNKYSKDMPDGCGYILEYIPYVALYSPKLCLLVYTIFSSVVSWCLPTAGAVPLLRKRFLQ